MDVPSREGRGFLLVAAGGSIGAAGRWWLRDVVGTDVAAFPWATLITNAVGAILIALVAGRLVRGSAVWLFAVSGAIGGFTTFSAFAVETERLADAGRTASAVAYLAATLAVGAAAQLLARRSGATT